MANLIDNDAKIISARNEGFGNPAIVRTSSGRLYTGHVNDSGELEIRYSDNGTSWTLDETFDSGSGNGDIDQFSFAISNRGDIFVTYSFSTDTDVYTLIVQKRDYSSGTWSSILSETSIDSHNIVLKPILIWNRSPFLTRLHIFWGKRASGSSTIAVYNKYTDNYGTGWTNGDYPHNITDGNYPATLWSGDSDSTGKIYILEGMPGISWRVWRVEFNITGNYITRSEVTGASNKSWGGAIIAIDNANDRWVLARNNSDSVTTLYKNGSSVGNSIFTSTSLSGMISLGVDGAGNAWCFHSKTSDEKAYYRKYTKETSSWGTETVLSTGDGLRVGSEKITPIGITSLFVSYYTN